VELEVVPVEAPVVRFENASAPDQVPPSFVGAVKEGAVGAAWSGPLMGYPVIKVAVRLTGGGHHQSDSTEAAFAAAAAAAFEEAVGGADPQLLEQIMRFEIHVPETYRGGVIHDLQGRRAEIHEVGKEGDMDVLRGTVPLSEVFGYTTDLRSITQGRGSCSLEPFEYAPVSASARKALLGS
jgi:elongation factor G